MSESGSDRRKLLLFALAIVVIASIAFVFRNALSLEYLAERETELRQFQQQHPWLVYALALGLYVAVAGLSIPGATVLGVTYGWFFGFFPAVILVSFASTLGATIAFWLSRYLLYDSVQQRFGEQLANLNQNLDSEGPFYLFVLRLVPLFPFFVVNLVMGLTPIRTSTYWWVSQLGMLPGTSVFVWAGSNVPTLSKLAEQGSQEILSWQLIAAFVLIGVFPLAIRWLLRWVRPTSLQRT